jgi:autotransporter-associated beta strand protein
MAFGGLGITCAQSPYYTDSGSPANPTWAQILPSLSVASNDPGPVNGSLLNVVNTLTEVGYYGDRTFSVGARRIHVCCNSSATNFTNFGRWYQQDGNTEVFRLFVNDENTSSSRPNAARCESFTTDKWLHSDFVTYEWTGHYTIAKRQQSYAIFQVKNDEDDWAVQLGLGGSGQLVVNNRRNASDVTVKNPDGTDKDFDGLGFDVRIQDDGNRYKVWIDGKLLADNFYDRNDVAGNETNFRWGKYMGDSKLTAPSDVSVIMVSGAQVRSWPGRLTAPVADIEKANNAQNLQNNASWTGGVVPGIHKRALWDSSVNSTNVTATLSAAQAWGGIKITNPAAQVTINGSATLGIDRYGVDMSAATRNLVVNCPVETRDASTWNLATGRSATFNGVVSGLAGVKTAGSGTVILAEANTYTGDTEIEGGTFRLGNGGTTGALSVNSAISVSAGATFEVSRSNTVTQGTHFSGEAITGAGGLRKSGTGMLTLTAANTYIGPTTINAGTLAFSVAGAFANSSTLSIADASQLRPTFGGVEILTPIVLGGAGSTASISAPTSTPGGGVVTTFTLSGIISGASNLTFTSSADQNALSTVRLKAQNTYTGSTLLDTSGTAQTQIIVRLGTHNALPPTTVVTIDGQDGSGTGRFAEINLNGFNQQLAGLTNVARTLRNQRIVNSNAASAATLTINGSGNHTFTGSLGGSANGSVSASAMPGSTSGNNFALTKSGAGTFTIGGTHSYFGNTTVTQGILELNSPNTNNQASTITIAVSNASLRLNFSGTDTVDKLFIGTTQLPPGVYKATGSAASGIALSQLAGSGTLTVTSGPAASFAAWQLVQNITGAINADHDQDGVANGIEYFLHGLSGNSTGSTTLPSVVNSSGMRSITWTHSTEYGGVYGTDFTVESNNTLGGTWTTETLGGNVTITGREVRYTFPPGTKGFVRLKVSSP